MPHAQRTSYEVILNRESGTIVRMGVDAVADTVKEQFTAAGCQVKMHCVVGKEFSATVAKAIEGDADAVVVGGGDGSVASAANLCAEHDKPLGILPLGTLNLAARDVGMPLELPEAVRALIDAPVCDMDLMEIDGRYHLCVIVIGFYPSLAIGRPEYHGSWVAKTCRTVWDTFLSIRAYPPLTLRLRDADTEQVHRTRLTMIANNDYEDLLGIIPTRRSLDGGYFTVYVFKHQSRLALMRSGLAWVMGRWRMDPDVTRIRATELEIDVKRRSSLAVMMDGELHRVPLPFSIKIKPRGLKVIAPLDEPQKE